MNPKITIPLLIGNLVVILGVANWITLDKEVQLTTGRRILLEVTRYDPRSLMQGDYMALSYLICAEIDRHLATDARGEGQVVIAVDADDVGRFRRMFDSGPLAADELLLHYRIRWGRSNRARVAAEEYFFQEGKAAAFESARYAELRVTPQGRTLLVALRDSDRNRIGD